MSRLVFVALVVAGALPARAAEPPRRLLLSEAIELAVKVSPEIALTSATAGGAEARVRGARAQRLPKLNASGTLFFWDKALELDLGDMLPMGVFDTTVRDRVTASLTVSVTQPLSGLLVVHRLIGLEQDGADAARADQAGMRINIAARAAEVYLRALQARASEAVALKSVEQLEAQLERARILEKGGVLGTLDVLRLEAARDQARQTQLRAGAGARTAERALARLLGWHAATPLELVDDLPAELPPPRRGEEEAAGAALRRPEIVAASERVSQAENGRRVAQAGYLPNLSGVASYQHNEGQGTFQPQDGWYLGLTMSWDLWDWGKTGAAVDEAAAQRRAATANLHRLGGELEVEARRRALEASAAHESLALAASTLKAVEEAYRIQTVRFREGNATTTDLLEAEAEVARARGGVALTRYEYLISQVALARATGELPDLSR
jgi:outer membrane protein